ncbi:MAG: hypothetical protein WBX15_15425 [Thermoanaerobaculia bacterium]
MWALRIALARARPVNAALLGRFVIVSLLFGAFLYGDFVVFRRLFRAAANIERLTPFFALGLLENFLGMVFLVALMVLFSSSATSAIGALFSDLDLELYHSSPRPRTRILLARWVKTFVQSAWVVVAFLLPMFIAFALQYHIAARFLAVSIVAFLLLLTVPVSIGALVVVLLVRLFPVRRVHQIAATLGILFVTLVIVGIRLARPERLFADIQTDDMIAILRAIRLPSSQYIPSSWIAGAMVGGADGVFRWQEMLGIVLLAGVAFALYFGVGRSIYFTAFVRARESSAPVAIGSGAMVRLLDRVVGPLSPPLRAMIGKEARVVTRDAAQWSQLFMMVALLFLYLYNIRMIPVAGDARAVLLAYLNVGMSGFVVSAICLRFAYPSMSAEGKQFWILASAPLHFRRILLAKTIVYTTPLLLVMLILTVLTNAMLGASREVWILTLAGGTLITLALVALGVGMGGWSPDFRTENPLEVALSLGGLAYMAVSMLYVGLMMFLFARPVQRFLIHMIFGGDGQTRWIVGIAPIVIGVTTSAVLTVLPLRIAERRLAALRRA